VGDEALHAEPGAAPRAGEGLASSLDLLLAVEPDARGPRRIAGALAEAVRSADFAALAVRGEGDRLEVVASFGLEGAPPESIASGLAADALAASDVRVARYPGAPFPADALVGAAAPLRAGRTEGVLLLGSRSVDALGDEALLLLRIAADRAALLLECERIERDRAEAASANARAEQEVEGRRRAVDYILGVVGHDLRNPLGAIHMSAALLQKKGGLEGWQGRTVERMRSSAGRMGRIIADLLSYTRTRLGSGLPIAARPARLDEIVSRVVDELSAANPDRAIEVSRDGDLAGEWDPDRLEQVASNLVSNAVDHGDPSAPVRVELAAAGDAVTLTVRNKGPTMPPEVLAHLFEPFSRGPDEKSRKASGLGLGLYISREIVRGHGGDIRAAADGETVVTVRLPRRTPQRPQ
jgi:signal transduction histidine kinase